MIDRYALPEMQAVWSDARRLQAWQHIEVLAAQAWADVGVVPAEAARAIAAAPPVDPEAWSKREAETRHDVAAFVDILAASAGEHGRWVHYGLTSSDIVDTALATTLRDAAALLLGRLEALFAAVRARAVEHRDTAMLGRTHGMWAEPTTFGHKLAGFGFELARATGRLRSAASEVAHGKISGAVGNHSTVPPEVERHVLDALGLVAEPAATQVVPRDRHASYLTALALVGAALERMAIEIRHLQRSEVAEVAEPFSEGQKGSSAMPHKHNPILSENVTGMARLLRAYALTGMENVALWHERDISHSSVERVALPDASMALDFALARMTRIIEGLTVDADRMRANLEAANGLVFSQRALLALIRKGMGRDEAYRLVQGAAAAALERGTHLRQALAAGDVPFDDSDLDSIFDLTATLDGTRAAVDALTTTTP
jgi:adenylosuccinate lyase